MAETDFKIYDEQYFGGQYERLTQNINGFNGASNGAMLLSSRLVPGDFERESFMAMLAGLIRHRDPNGNGTVADATTTQGELVGVKVNKGIGPVADTLDKWKKISRDPAEFSFYVGAMVADQKLQDMVNTAVLVLDAAIANIANFTTDKSATGTLIHNYLVDVQRPLGDQAGKIVAWIMHSKSYFDLVGQAITDKVFNVGDVAIYTGTTPTLGKPVLVIDAPALAIAGAPNKYHVLAPVAGAVEITESEQESVIFQPVTGKENLEYRLQGEYAYNANVKGVAWDVTNGGKNPDSTALGTATNWDLAATDGKNGPGARLITQ